MRTPPWVLVVDDNPANIDIIETRLASQGYRILIARDGEEALAQVREHKPDLILLDVMMPKKDGFEVCRELKADRTLPFIPIILVTAKDDTRDVIAGLDAGGDEYLTKPVDTAALLARVRSILRTKTLHDEVQAQAVQLEAQARELADWNKTLESRVAQQVAEIDRMGRLKRFLPPQVAEIIVSRNDERLLESHRRDVTVVFCDLRGFTAFAEMAEPEEVMGVLREYHACLGPLIQHHEGTLERFAGDGLLVLFNDPIQHEDHTERAVQMALSMQDGVGMLVNKWHGLGHDLGFGIGIARGVRHARPDRVRAAHGLRGDRHGDQPRGPALRRGQGRTDPGEPARGGHRGGHRDDVADRRAVAQRVRPQDVRVRDHQRARGRTRQR